MKTKKTKTDGIEALRETAKELWANNVKQTLLLFKLQILLGMETIPDGEEVCKDIVKGADGKPLAGRTWDGTIINFRGE